MEEENDWKVSNQNKKNGKKRFLRQLIVFLIAIIVIGIVVFKLVYLVPIIGGLLSFVSILIGLGYSKELMFPKKK